VLAKSRFPVVARVTTQPVSIRLAEPEHLKAIAAIELAAATRFAESDLPQSLRHKVTEMSYLRVTMDGERLWIALTDKEKPVGFAITDVIDKTAHLDELDVLPEFGRQGIGTRLLSTVVDWARAGQFPNLQLMTFRHVPWNAPFYEKLGFEILDASDYGPQTADLIRKESRAGLDVDKRVVMRLTF